MSVEGNLWYVKTADGDVHRMTLDQIDEAFNAGRIDVDTMCLPGGATRWARLGALAGLDEPAAAPAPAAFAPAAFASPAFAAVPHSLRPVAMEVNDDLDALDAPFARKSRKGRVFGFVAVAAVLGAGAFLAVRSGAVRALAGVSTTGAAAAAVAMPAPPPPPQASPPPAAPAPPTPPADLYAPPVPATAPASDSNAAHLSDAQRAKLLAADKAREEAAKARKKARSQSHRSRKYKSQGFTTNGNKYDPLNAGF